MNLGHSWRESDTLVAIRQLLLGMLIFGILGTVAELVLLGHVEMPAQWIPLVVMGVSGAVIARHHSRPSAASVRAIQLVMALFIVTGVIGVGMHLNGNLAFERELHPDERGFELVRKTLAGATPVLAPGSMVLLGFVGLAHTYRHPYTANPGHPGGQEAQS